MSPTEGIPAIEHAFLENSMSANLLVSQRVRLVPKFEPLVLPYRHHRRVSQFQKRVGGPGDGC